MGSGSFLGIGGWEFVIILAVFILIVGPQRLPEYTRSIVRGVRKARQWVEDSRETVEQEMGIAVDDLKKYDPRQYDPRKIIRDAWGDTTPLEDLVGDTKNLVGASAAGVAAVGAAARGTSSGSTSRGSSGGSSAARADDGPRRAPWDDEAT